MITNHIARDREQKGSLPGDKIRLLVVSGSLGGGGAERFVSRLLEHLNTDWFSPSLCLMRDRIEYSLDNSFPLFFLDHRNRYQLFRTVRRLRKVIEEVRPDVVLSNSDYTGQFVGEAIDGCRVQPGWIARIGNSPDRTRGLRKWFKRYRLHRIYPRVDLFVANSQGLTSRFAEIYPYACNRIRTLGNPIDVDRIARQAAVPSNEESSSVPVLIWMGRLYPQKRPDVLLDAFRQILSDRPAQLVVCGGRGPLRDWFRQRIAALGLENAVRIFHFQPNPFTTLANADLALSTSDYEGLSNAVLEAQALGVPVVATRCEYGNAEIVSHNETGLLTETGNATAVANAALRLLDNPTLRHAMGEAARERIRSLYDVQILMPQWESLFFEIAMRQSQHLSPTSVYHDIVH